MFAVGNVLIGLGRALGVFFEFYLLVLFARAVCSWVDASRHNPIVRFLYMATEPPMRVIARLLPSSLRYFPIDISFLILVAIVVFLEFALAQTLVDLGVRLNPPPVRMERSL